MNQRSEHTCNPILCPPRHRHKPLQGSASPRISLINILLILIQYRLPINLLRRRRQPIRRSPLLISHHHAIDNLNPCQPAASACVLQLLKDDAVELLIAGEFFEVV